MIIAKMKIDYADSEKTLEVIKYLILSEKKGVYLRFGDGDVNLANNQSELLQRNNQKLAFEMREAMSLNGDSILKCLPLCCKKYGGLENGMFPGNHESPDSWCDNILEKSYRFWNQQNKMDVFCAVALSHQATVNPEKTANFLSEIFNSVPWILLIGNEKIPDQVKSDLFFNKKFLHIKTPSSNSYEAIDRLEREADDWIKQNQDFGLIITSMGCSGRVLQKRLFNRKDNNFFIFDFGSLMDALCGWKTRAWIELTNFSETNFLEMIRKKNESFSNHSDSVSIP